MRKIQRFAADMASKRQYKEYLLDESKQPSRATKHRRIAKEKENTSYSRENYKKYLYCATSDTNTKRKVLEEIPLSFNGEEKSSLEAYSKLIPTCDMQNVPDEEPFTEEGASSQPYDESIIRKHHVNSAGEEQQQETPNKSSSELARDEECRQSHSVLELPQTAYPDSTFTYARGDQQDMQTEVQELYETQPEHIDSATTFDQQEIPKSKTDPLDGDDLAYPGAPLTKGQSLLLLMSYVLRHNLTSVALEHLLKIFNEHLPGMAPVTTYLFHKAYGQYGNYQPHFYCPACGNYLGDNTSELQCSACHAITDSESCLKSGCFFLVLKLASQLKTLLEQKQTSLNKDQLSADEISDIQFGEEYRKLKDSGELGEDDISLIWNCDGIPVFKSSKYQIWPIQCQVIELEPKERKANICLPCLWFGEKKPNMLTFLKPFVDELLVLERDGIKWKDSANIEHVSKVYALICSSDSVARPLLRNTKQFNGFYGCDFCYHVGGGPYINKAPKPHLRNEAEHFHDAMAATPENPVMGVKGPSLLMKLKTFQMINGFVPEYQHCVCLGVTRQLAKLWFDSKHHDKEWYIGTKADNIDKELIAIKPPVEITRVPRSVADRKYWKASEWRSFLLFYALPTLNGVLVKKFWNHLFLLVFAMHILLGQKVKHSDIELAERALKKFTMLFEKLYGAANMTFNVHLLTHIAASVRNWGPLWATSTFSFESFNGTLLHYFSGTTHVPEQIVKRFLCWRSLTQKAGKIMADANDGVKNVFSDLINNKLSTSNSSSLNENVRVFGTPCHGKLSALQTIAIKNLLGVTVRHCECYHRFIIKGILYHSSSNRGLKKRINSTVELQDGRLCRILSMVVFKRQHLSMHCVLVKELMKTSRQLCRDGQLNIASTFVSEVLESKNVYAVPTELFYRKAVLVQSRGNEYVIPLPNNVERD
ncbi:uncharacterized protein LOC143508558 [Brachyhypopomus gauderio]|uniref:uncharacterized protein LOC143503741 n=1 Tax=Brachyhypopomus gauderio TaxID=698409 RepID=UPI0040414CBC